MKITPDAIIKMAMLRRNLTGTIQTIEKVKVTAVEALDQVNNLLIELQPVCKYCMYEKGLVEECRCSRRASPPHLSANKF